MNEQWKPIPAYDGFYEVSDHGRVRSVDRLVDYGRHGAAAYKSRLIRPRPTKKGYPMVSLSRGGVIKAAYVHHLVLLAFVGERPEVDARSEIRHLDGDKTNNSLTNLVYGTIHENWEDRRRHRERDAA